MSVPIFLYASDQIKSEDPRKSETYKILKF